MSAFTYSERSIMTVAQRRGLVGRRPAPLYMEWADRMHRLSITLRRNIHKLNPSTGTPDIPFPLEMGVTLPIVIKTYQEVENFRMDALKEKRSYDNEDETQAFARVHEELVNQTEDFLSSKTTADLSRDYIPELSDIAWIPHVYNISSAGAFLTTLREDSGLGQRRIASKLYVTKSAVTQFEDNISSIRFLKADNEKRIPSPHFSTLNNYLTRGLLLGARSPITAALCYQLLVDYHKELQKQDWKGETASYQDILKEFDTFSEHSSGHYIRELLERKRSELSDPLELTQKDIAQHMHTSENSVSNMVNYGISEIIQYPQVLDALGYTPGSKESIVLGMLAIAKPR